MKLHQSKFLCSERLCITSIPPFFKKLKPCIVGFGIGVTSLSPQNSQLNVYLINVRYDCLTRDV